MSTSRGNGQNKRQRNYQENYKINKQKGKRAEDKALNYFEQRGYALWRRNHRVAGVEIDLILKKQSWFLVEVKNIRNLEEISFRLPQKQKQRILYARAAWESWRQEPVSLKVLFVSLSDIVELDIEDF